MITLISFLVVLTGCINWLCIGIFQYDFIAGMFGSQANVFSRIVYGIFGLAALVMVYAALKNKGRIMATGRRASDMELGFKRKKKEKPAMSGDNTHSEAMTHNDTNNTHYDNNTIQHGNYTENQQSEKTVQSNHSENNHEQQ